MGLKTDGAAVKERMTARGCDPAKIELVAPFLRAGFDAAQKEAQGKARECKASWKTITGGEAYGSNKAASWRAAKPEVKTADLAQARVDLVTIENEIEAETTRLGELQGRAKQAAEQEARLQGLRQQAGLYARIADKLARDEGSLKELEEKVEATRAKAGMKPEQNTAPHPCPHCGGLLLIQSGQVEQWHEETLPHYDPGAAAQLPEHERALKLMQNAVANGKRDVAAADAAARTLKELEDSAEDQDQPTDLGPLQERINVLKHSRGNQQHAIRLIEELERCAAEADTKTAKAAALHSDVQQWEAISDALAPDGIPGEMLSEALGPINERLRSSSVLSEWAPVVIDSDMLITYGLRDYALISESEKWRADAMIAEAIAHLSGVRLLVLDRFDVLDLKGREDLLYWLDGVAGGDIDTALIFGTLKGLPAQLPETVEAFWIENGMVGQMKEAA
jgi:hypothetical protein